MNIYNHFKALFKIQIMKTASSIILFLCFIATPLIAISQDSSSSSDTVQINKLRTLASNYQKNKQYQESIIIYQSLIKVQPENLTLHLDLALSYYYNQNFQLAKTQIDYVKAHPSFTSAPELVVLNVEKLYQSINKQLVSGNFKDPTFPSNKKTWDAFISLTGSGNETATLITDINEVEKESTLALSAHVFLNYKIIKPIENWRLDQNISIYQLGESNDTLSTFNNVNYNIGYKKVLEGNRIISSEFSAFYTSRDTITEPSLAVKAGYQFKNQQFLVSARKHWLNIQLTDPLPNDTENSDTIPSERLIDYWTVTTQYKSFKKWPLSKRFNSIALNWKTKPTYMSSELGYFRIDQQIGSVLEINEKVSWLTKLQISQQEFKDPTRTDKEISWNQSINYDINPNWLTSFSQKYKFRHSTAADKMYTLWQYQITLKWVN